jgi:hypothetical protein
VTQSESGPRVYAASLAAGAAGTNGPLAIGLLPCVRPGSVTLLGVLKLRDWPFDMVDCGTGCGSGGVGGPEVTRPRGLMALAAQVL